MGFYQELKEYQEFDIEKYFSRLTGADIERILGKDRIDRFEYLALLSPRAENYLEAMAQRAHRLTVQHFGRVILLYTPIYLANYCENQCVYCGFRAGNKLERKKLTLTQVEDEARIIAATGLKHVIVLTGESRKHSSVSYMRDCVEVLKGYFSSVNIEVYPLEQEEYALLVDTGVDSLTIYQETYDEELYLDLHPSGPKRNYRYRLEAPERCCRAGIRTVNIGALLGLHPWRSEAFFTGLHADFIQSKYPEVDVAISLPRMRPFLGGYQPRHLVSDKNMVQYMLAFRLFMPRAGITISTRERADFRDNLVRLGVTKMSAGSCTAVGGRVKGSDEGQFDISDQRDVEEIRSMLYRHGYQPVFKDWQHF